MPAAASCSGVVSATACATSPAASSSVTRIAHSGAGTPTWESSLIRGPPTSKEKAPLPATATRRSSPLAASARASAPPSAWQRAAEGIGRIEELIQIGTSAKPSSGAITPSGARIVWSRANSWLRATSKPSATSEAWISAASGASTAASSCGSIG